MTITIFRSTDGGAPSYTNVAGALLGVLDKLVSVGWTKTVLGTNQASYTQPSGSNGRILQVDDSGAASATVTGWETLTALNTGTYQFPNTGASGNPKNGFFVDHASSGVAVPWRLITNGSLFHFVVQYNTGSNLWNLFTFGDYVSVKSGAVFNTMLAAMNSVNGGASSFGYMGGSATPLDQINSGNGYPMAIDRSNNQLTASPNCHGFTRSAWIANSGVSGVGGPAFPDPISGSVNMAPVWISDILNGQFMSVAGYVPGIWASLHAANSFNDGDTFSVSVGTQAGRSFEVAGHSATVGQFFLETSNTWGGFY